MILKEGKMFSIKHFVFVIVAILSIKTSHSRTLKVCMEPKGTFPIYVERGKERSKNPGLYFEVFKLLEKKMRIKFKVKRRPFKRCLVTLKSGKVDLLASASYKESREEFGVYPTKNKKLLDDQRISESAYYLYYLKNKRFGWDNKNLKSIRGTVGVNRGYSIGRDLKESKVRIRELNDVKQLFGMLIRNRLNLVAVHENDGDMWLKKRGFENLRKSNMPLKKKNYYLLVSHRFHKSNRSFSEKLWKALGEIRVSDQYAKIKSKYLEKGKW